MRSNPVLRTLIYESLFEFPLYKEEIWKFLISNKKITKNKFEEYLKDKNVKLSKKTGFYFLDKESVVRMRLKRKKISLKKIIIARKAAKIISLIPSISFVGISGSLALHSAKENDDIDFFIICDKNTIWSSRFLSVIFMKILGIYRNDKISKNKICLNMFVSKFEFPKDRQDLYNAFEISQILPLFQRNKSYGVFLRENGWINKFLPNATGENLKLKVNLASNLVILSFLFELLRITEFERFARFIQLSIMKKITNEIVSDSLFAFHPRDFRQEIMRKYEGLIGTTRGH